MVPAIAIMLTCLGFCGIKSRSPSMQNTHQVSLGTELALMRLSELDICVFSIESSRIEFRRQYIGAENQIFLVLG